MMPLLRKKVLCGWLAEVCGWSDVVERFTCKWWRRAANIAISIRLARKRIHQYSRRPLCLMGSCGGVYVCFDVVGDAQKPGEVGS